MIKKDLNNYVLPTMYLSNSIKQVDNNNLNTILCKCVCCSVTMYHNSISSLIHLFFFSEIIYLFLLLFYTVWLLLLFPSLSATVVIHTSIFFPHMFGHLAGVFIFPPVTALRVYVLLHSRVLVYFKHFAQLLLCRASPSHSLSDSLSF